MIMCRVTMLRMAPATSVAAAMRSEHRWAFPHGEVVGKRIRPVGKRWRTIVGVVGNVRHASLIHEAESEVFVVGHSALEM